MLHCFYPDVWMWGGDSFERKCPQPAGRFRPSPGASHFPLLSPSLLRVMSGALWRFLIKSDTDGLFVPDNRDTQLFSWRSQPLSRCRETELREHLEGRSLSLARPSAFMPEYEMMTPLCPAGWLRHLGALPATVEETVAVNSTRLETALLLARLGSHLMDPVLSVGAPGVCTVSSNFTYGSRPNYYKLAVGNIYIILAIIDSFTAWI